MKGCSKLVLYGIGIVFLFGIALSVLDAAGQRMGLIPTNTPSPPATLTPTLTLTPLETHTPAPTATTTLEPTPEAAMSLPIVIKSSDGWIFNVEQIEFLESFETPSKRYRPDRDLFMVLIGTISNLSDEDGCIHASDVSLIYGHDRISMKSAILKAAKKVYGLGYPGIYIGQCLDYDESVNIFLAFDVPVDEYMWLEIMDTQGKIGVVTELEQMFAAATATAQPTPTFTPKPTYTLTPTPTQTPTPTLISVSGIVIQEGWFHYGPGLEFGTKSDVVSGAEIVVVGMDDSGEWYVTDTGDWIASTQVEVIASDIPTVSPTPIPAATSTSTSTPTVTPISTSTPEPTSTATSTTTPTPTPTTTPTLTVEQYRAQASSPDVKDLTRNTESYIGQIVTYTGGVLQVMETQALFSDKVTYIIRLGVDHDFENIIVAKLVYEDGLGFRPLEGDTVTIWGPVEGRERYKTVLGAQVVLPSIFIEGIELQN